MAVVIVDNGSKYTPKLIEMLADRSPRVVAYTDIDNGTIQRNDTIILTGGHAEPILWHKKQYARETRLVNRHKGTIVGICFGFEVIAHVYGSHLHLRHNRIKGDLSLKMTGRGRIAIPNSITVYENHNWTLPKVRRPLIATAYSEYGVEAFQHSRKPIYGMQFHPEMSGSEGRALLNDILDAAIDNK